MLNENFLQFWNICKKIVLSNLGPGVHCLLYLFYFGGEGLIIPLKYFVRSYSRLSRGFRRICCFAVVW